MFHGKINKLITLHEESFGHGVKMTFNRLQDHRNIKPKVRWSVLFKFLATRSIKRNFESVYRSLTSTCSENG